MSMDMNVMFSVMGHAKFCRVIGTVTVRGRAILRVLHGTQYLHMHM